jgi:hypothetical protein
MYITPLVQISEFIVGKCHDGVDISVAIAICAVGSNHHGRLKISGPKMMIPTTTSGCPSIAKE